MDKPTTGMLASCVAPPHWDDLLGTKSQIIGALKRDGVQADTREIQQVPISPRALPRPGTPLNCLP